MEDSYNNADLKQRLIIPCSSKHFDKKEKKREKNKEQKRNHNNRVNRVNRVNKTKQKCQRNINLFKNISKKYP